MPVHYSPKLGALSLVRWRGTVIQSVSQSHIFWLLQSFHISFILMMDYHKEWMITLPWSAVQPPLALATFFLVFYGGNCYNRFFQLHGHCVGLGGSLMEWVSDVKLHFKGQPVSFRQAHLV